MFAHFIYHKYIKRRKDPLTKGAKCCDVNSRSDWNEDATPSPCTQRSKSCPFDLWFNALPFC